MVEMRDLLVEIGTEELPPKALRRLAQAFADGVGAGMAKAALAHGELHHYATPRRLAVWVQGVPIAQADRIVERRGPALTAGFDDEGRPSKAAQGFARSCGVSVDELEKLETDKGAWLVYRSQQQGMATPALLPDIVRQSLAALPVPKRMRWGALREEFVRPVHWLVLLFGDEVIDCEMYGVRAGRETRGHRHLHAQPIYLSAPQAYAPLLESEGHVLPDFAARKEAVRGQVMETAARLGGRAVIDEALLEEVTALVEWPVAVAGDFEKRFLELPSEPLISTMKGNQRYFHLVDAAGKLLPHFITVANIESRDEAQVRAGNERVIRPRFSDAAFFWDKDRKQSLAARSEALKSVVFQAKLGTVYEKSARSAALAAAIATDLGGDAPLAQRAALVAKCDLLTDMVGEFPELQGVMGRYYALAEGLPAEFAEALDEQYLPRYAGDRLPVTIAGRALAIADKLDTLLGIFAIDQVPSGDKDPFALRRAALGVLRIIIECALPLDLATLLQRGAEHFAAAVPARAVVGKVYDFMMERLRAYYSEAGIPADVFEAVLECRPTRPHDFDMRVRGVSAFRLLPEAESLAAANKRIRNILKQASERGEPVPEAIETSLLSEAAERHLAEAMNDLAADVNALYDAGDYTAALQRLAALRAPVDAFFDSVMVMTEDARLRGNRLALLARLNGLFLRAADFSRLQ